MTKSASKSDSEIRIQTAPHAMAAAAFRGARDIQARSAQLEIVPLQGSQPGRRQSKASPARLPGQPQFVTFTGVDEWADLDRMRDMSRTWPIEWGVLIGDKSGSGAGKPRYPGIRRFHEIVQTPGLRLALHMCGWFASAVNEGRAPDLPYHRFARVQVNCTAEGMRYDLHTLQAFSHRIERPVIFQAGDFPDPLVLPMQDRSTLQTLFDRSGGRGVAPDSWPACHHDGLVGYAGGIGPGNVARVLDRIDARNFWIDMETGIRGPSRAGAIERQEADRLDLDRCEAVCRAIWPTL